MASEYRFDYKKAKPNRFASRMKNEPLVVMIEPDIAKIFTTPEQVNKALRALISAMPEKKARVKWDLLIILAGTNLQRVLKERERATWQT